MKRLILPLLAVFVLIAGRRSGTNVETRAAIAFDLSPALSEIEQFIPDKPIVMHAAVESTAELQESTKGPGAGLGATPPAPPSPRAGIRTPRTGGPPPIPAPPVAPEVSAASVAVEQTTQGSRPAIAADRQF